MIKLRQFVVFATFFLSSLTIFAASSQQDPGPLVELKSASAEMLTMLQQNKARIRHDHNFLEAEVKKIVMPHFALNNMSKAVVGKNAWDRASDQQKEEFKREFTSLVLQIYSAPLATYDDDRIDFFPLRGKAGNDNAVTVRSIIVRKSGQRIPVNYYMIRVENKWFVKDFSIEGISMIESYRSQFAETLSQEQFAGLLKQIKQHNKNT